MYARQHKLVSNPSTWLPRSQETTPPYDPTVGLCLGPYSGLGVLVFSYERGTPAPMHSSRTPLHAPDIDFE